MSTGPAGAPEIPAYLQDSAGLFYRIGGPEGQNEVYLQPAAPPVPTAGDALLWADPTKAGTVASTHTHPPTPMALDELTDVTAPAPVAGDLLTRNAAGQWVNQAPVVVSSVPPGAITAFAGATAPTGWLICDGAAVSRTTYAALFAVCGVAYGIGNGSTTFNIPNLKARMPFGLDTTPGLDALGITNGTTNHIHGLSSGRAQVAFTSPNVFAMNRQGHNWTPTHTGTTGGSLASAATPQTVAAMLSGTADGANIPGLPPFLILNFIIKT